MLFTSFLFLAGLYTVLALPAHEWQANHPVIAQNFMDPSVIQLDDGTWVAYAAINFNPEPVHVLAAVSSDFTTWKVLHGYDVLPVLPGWASNNPSVWAVDVIQLVREWTTNPLLPPLHPKH
jgi:hypothetical protein